MKAGDRYLFKHGDAEIVFEVTGEKEDTMDNGVVVICIAASGPTYYTEPGIRLAVVIEGNKHFAPYFDPVDCLKEML